MTAKKTYEELVELLQAGKIGFLRFVMDGENAEDYLEWCQTHGTDSSDESAEFYVEQTDIDQVDRQVIGIIEDFMQAADGIGILGRTFRRDVH